MIRRTGETAQMIKVLAKKPDDQSSVPGTHTVKGESGLPKGVL